MKLIVNGIFEAAVDREVIDSNTFKRISIKVRFAQQNRKADVDRYYNAEELEDLRKWMISEYKDSSNIACVAVLIQAVTGMRIGELGALTWNDIMDDKIHVHRELVLDKSDRTYHIVDHTKGYTDRFIPFHPKMKEYLNMVRSRNIVYSDLVLRGNDGGYLTTRCVNNILEKYAGHKGLEAKRSHCLRRTYATLLYLVSVDKETIKDYLGHKDIKTTEGYICAQRDVYSTYELLSRAL